MLKEYKKQIVVGERMFNDYCYKRARKLFLGKMMAKVKKFLTAVLKFVFAFPIYVIRRFPLIIQWSVLPAKYFARKRFEMTVDSRLLELKSK